jgi:hypothetical protein
LVSLGHKGYAKHHRYYYTEHGWDKITSITLLLTGLLGFNNNYKKIVIAVRLKHSGLGASADVKSMLNDLIHAMLWQCMFAQYMSILQSLCVCYNIYVYATISMSIPQYPSVNYNLYVYTTITMCILQSLWALWAICPWLGKLKLMGKLPIVDFLANWQLQMPE